MNVANKLYNGLSVQCLCVDVCEKFCFLCLSPNIFLILVMGAMAMGRAMEGIKLQGLAWKMGVYTNKTVCRSSL